MLYRMHLKYFLLACTILYASLFISCSKDDEPGTVEIDVVINELMPLNNSTATDPAGEYDDWIELYNNSETEADLSGYFMTDNENNLTRWRFPDGTVIRGHGYLILWADGELDQDGLHTDFGLSADGEELLLVTPDIKIAEKVTFGPSEGELSYARNPNGSGSFEWGTPTFNTEN